jgi:pimeloyl-ACP methyl ester carboxylesterase
MATVVYLHGVGGARAGWAEPLVLDCLARGVAARIVAINYADLLADLSMTGGTQAPRVEALDHSQPYRDSQEYRARQRSIADVLTAVGETVDRGSSWASFLPRPAQVLRMPWGSQWGSQWGLDQAKRYLDDAYVRERIRIRVADSLTQVMCSERGPVVLIGHSLGALVALDVLSSPRESGESHRFAPNLLVTLGAPLGHEDITHHLIGRRMPIEDLGAWVNVVHHLDPVQGGRGASEYFPEAHDVFLPGKTLVSNVTDLAVTMKRAITAHLDSTYLSSPTVQAAVAWGLDRIYVHERVGR